MHSIKCWYKYNSTPTTGIAVLPVINNSIALTIASYEVENRELTVTSYFDDTQIVIVPKYL